MPATIAVTVTMPRSQTVGVHQRPQVRGKFFFVGEQKLYLRGVTYGTFRPDAKGHEFPAPEMVERDFSMMAENGVSAVRTYTVPPRWLLDTAHRHGLWIMAGLPVERSAAFADYEKCVHTLEAQVREQVRTCAGHRALLAYVVGNEIPTSLVRWHGRRRMERFLERLHCVAKAEDPGGLVTYANYPSTEYLQLPFLDFACYNVYLESQAQLETYLARLHNLTGDHPLILGEIGLDSLRHGEAAQARSLDWQVRASFASGCAGVFVYAWTDQWYRGGAEVDDWNFGLTDRARRPKPALAAVREAFADAPFTPDESWPRVSVIVCTHNGGRTLRDTFLGLQNLEYPNYEVIVVDDGSTDHAGTLALEHAYGAVRRLNGRLHPARPEPKGDRVCLINTPNRGLSLARNAGLEAATGEIIAYLDDDAFPDPHWLTYLVATFLNARGANFAGVGGPNIAPPDDGWIADCVAHAPGGPIHVLLTNRTAEHIPGCNMAFRKEALEAIGGFDPQFRVAGDDVDVCWRLQQAGWTLGFSPAAVVWHHRRNSVRAYWRQQCGYGKAEAMLERKWPEKYTAAGHAIWSGHIYNNGLTYLGWRVRRIYHGRWGLAPFQSLYEPAPSLIESFPMMPEWYLIIMALAVFDLLGFLWKPLHAALPLLAVAIGMSAVQACRCAARLRFDSRLRQGERWKRRLLTACLFLAQPLARLFGRLRHGLTLWRRHPPSGWRFPRPWTADIWTERAVPVEARLQRIETEQREEGTATRRGGDFDRWDLQVSGGVFGAARLSLAVDYHGSGRQLLRIRCWPHCSGTGFTLIVLSAGLAVGATVSGALAASAVLDFVTFLLLVRTVHECAFGTAVFLNAVRRIEAEEKIPDPANGPEPLVRR